MYLPIQIFKYHRTIVVRHLENLEQMFFERFMIPREALSHRNFHDRDFEQGNGEC